MSKHVGRWLARAICVVVCIAATASPAYPNQTDEEERAPRPKLLIPLCVTYGALQSLDIHSTYRALGAGGSEANPILAPMLPSSSALLIASKAATTTAMFVLTERLRRHHPRAALWTMIALDSGYAMVVANNYAVAAHARDGR
jgi:uncharacterized protein DUF5658